MAVIEVRALTKRFGSLLAVDRLSFDVAEGTVTGFLGPNGAGKTTTLRMLLGLVNPTEGAATILGRPYLDLPDPLRAVGAALEAANYHPGRTARDHLRVQAVAGRIPTSRADEVLEQVGLSAAARRRVGGFSLGMRQRLGLATALLGDPRVLILDEPANGLDPEGVRWLRDLLREQARQGKAVLTSSHILAEVAQTVDHVVVLDRGRLVTQASLEELTTRTQQVERIRTAQPDELRAALLAAGGTAAIVDSGWLEVTGLTPERVGIIAAERSIPIFETSSRGLSLEDIFFQLTTEREADEVTSGSGR